MLTSVAVVVVVLVAQAPAKKITETAHVLITTSVARPAPASARTITLAIDVAPKPLMHVYAPGQPGYLAITVTLDPDASFAAGTPKYPAGEKLFMPVLNETQLVYARPFRITQDVTLRPGAKPAASRPVVIKGTLRYQACDDKICYLPKSVPIEWTSDQLRDAERARPPL